MVKMVCFSSMEEKTPLPSMKTEDSPALPRTLAVSESPRFDCLVEYEFRRLNHQLVFLWVLFLFFWTAGHIP